VLAAIEGAWVAASLPSKPQRLAMLSFGAGIAAGALRGLIAASAASVVLSVLEGILFLSAAAGFAFSAVREFVVRF